MNLSRESLSHVMSNKTLPHRILNDGPLPSRINQTQWREIQKEEFINNTINSIRHEIIESAMQTVYKNHLEKNCHKFIVNTAHIAWQQLFNLMHLKCDPGETSTTVKKRWTGDEEPPTIPIDNWVCGRVATRESAGSCEQREKCNESCAKENSP